jgi:neutral amino acid transport system permease protein
VKAAAIPGGEEGNLLPRSRTLQIVLAILAVAIVLALVKGPMPVAQTTATGIVAGSYFALGALGLTLVFGVLRLVNFAHGDMLTFGAYMALAFSTGLGLPFAMATFLAIAATALLGVATEKLLWQPLRQRGANLFQMLLAAIGLALLLRHCIQFVASGAVRRFDVDITSIVELGPIRIGQMQAVVVVVGFAVLLATGLMLRFTRLGKEMRAVSDNRELAETAGVDTRRVIRWTWLLAGGLAGLAGVLYAASIGAFNPNIGFSLLLSLFAAAILGGIGQAYGALAGGIILALSQEWSTLFINARWKPAVGFAILILALIVLPRGLYGRKRAL